MTFVPRRLKTLALGCALLAAPALHTPSASTAGPRQTDAANVQTLLVTVTDGKGNLVDDLKREAFSVFDGEGRRLEIVSFVAGDVPASIAVLLDASGSMSRGETALARNALLRFFRHCHAGDEFFVGAFNHDQQLLVDGSNDAETILSALDLYTLSRKRGMTALYDALYLAMNRVGRGRHRRRAVILVTDGADNASQYTFEEIRRAVREGDVPVYAVVVNDDFHPLEIKFRGALEDLTVPTGGLVFFPKDEKHLYEAAVRLANVLRSQYEIGVVVPGPPARKDGWRDISVKAEKGGDAAARGASYKLKARTRRGFYWPPRGG